MLVSLRQRELARAHRGALTKDAAAGMLDQLGHHLVQSKNHRYLPVRTLPVCYQEIPAKNKFKEKIRKMHKKVNVRTNWVKLLAGPTNQS